MEIQNITINSIADLINHINKSNITSDRDKTDLVIAIINASSVVKDSQALATSIQYFVSNDYYKHEIAMAIIKNNPNAIQDLKYSSKSSDFNLLVSAFICRLNFKHRSYQKDIADEIAKKRLGFSEAARQIEFKKTQQPNGDSDVPAQEIESLQIQQAKGDSDTPAQESLQIQQANGDSDITADITAQEIESLQTQQSDSGKSKTEAPNNAINKPTLLQRLLSYISCQK